MIHDRLDLAHWVRQFPLSKLTKTSGAPGTLTGPADIAYVEQMRAAVLKAGADLGAAKPTDLCVWKLGDSEQRACTKIGGLPYWPARQPWPTADNGDPYTFVAQFCFADSKDIVPRLPGDILSVLALDSDYQRFSLHWFKRRNQKLLAAEAVPAPRWPILPCHAMLHRTAEYADADYKTFDQYAYPLSGWAHTFRDGSKIGGVWYPRGELQDPAKEKDKFWRKEMQKWWDLAKKQEQTFLCQLGSIQISKKQPFANVARASQIRKADAGARLSIADAGGIDFFFDGTDTDWSWWSG